MAFRHHLVRWEADYGPAGLAVVEISGGKYASFDYSRRSLARAPEHPILWDADNRNHGNYGIRGWPTAYLISAEGKVFWEGNPAWVQARPEELRAFKLLLEAQLLSVKKTPR